MAPPRIPPALRFMSHVLTEPNTGCWLWTAALNRGGYGKVVLRHPETKQRRHFTAHRWSYELFVGAIPDGTCVCHKCDVRCCVNPDHLFLGDHQSNAADREIKGRGRRSVLGLPPGVSKSTCCDKYEARVAFRGRRFHVGMFSSTDDAAQAAAQFKRDLYTTPPIT